MAIHDQLAHLPSIPDDFPEMAGTAPAKPVVPFPRYTKEWWLANYGAGKGFRLWSNPTRDMQRLEMQLAISRHIDPAEIKDHERMVVVEIPPGETIELPKIWDRAILIVKDGEIRGGMAPRLRPAGVNLTLCDGLQHFDSDPFAPGAA